jgi:acetoin utilization deacetylase AcuC-like enzyme
MALKVGIVRDDRYLLHQPGLVHPERPERLKAIYGMLDREFEGSVINVQPELASLEQLELIHTPNYVRKVLRTAERKFTFLAPDTPVSSQSYLAAYLAVGGCIKGLQALLSGRCDVCFALVRPPGHHALPHRAGGFCLFNNLGVTARYAMKRHGLSRILILDWDIHHGNGIQELFYGEKEVLYFSSHVLGWYPQTGDWEETGVGEGLGYNINVPLPKDIGDSDIVSLYDKMLNPLIARYKPELILVSAGFDGHCMDPIGRGRLTEICFGELAQLLTQLAESAGNIPVLLALEGGYEVTALVSCVKQVLDALVTSGSRPPLSISMSGKGLELFERAYGIHEKYGVWTTNRG